MEAFMAINKIQFKRGTADALAEVNPVPLAGEMIIETNTGKFKFGDGTTAWGNLGYAGGLKLPENDNKVYVMKNGAWIAATVVEQPTEWLPAIDDTEDIVLTLDEDMMPYQLTGNNVEVSG